MFALVVKASAENGFGEPYAKYAGGGSDAAYTVLAEAPTVCSMVVKGGVITARRNTPFSKHCSKGPNC